MITETKKFLIVPDLSVKQAMKRMTEIGQKTLFVVDKDSKLIGALSDGDIRKWILHNGSLKAGILKIYNKKPRSVAENFDTASVKKMMVERLIESIPVLNKENAVVKVLTWEDVFSEKPVKTKEPLKVQVVVMAGGKGTRLDPFTRILPKPLIPIGDKPIIEHIMNKFNEYGITEFFVTVNHKARMIKSYFEDSDGIFKIHYIEEKKPLGTAGSLRLLKWKIKEPFLVTNCDIIVNADCAEILKFHNENKYDMTIVVSCKHYIIPYGVCGIEKGGALKSIDEKPGYDFLVNTGMYVMKKKLLDLIPKNRQFDINQLIQKAQKQKFRIGVFPISEDSWIDIGQWEEYRSAIEKMRID